MDAEDATLQADASVDTAPGASPRALATKGTIVGRYVVLREVGRGAMGAVFAAIDPKLDRRVAVKLLLDDRRGGMAVARLIREAQSLAQLNHPNVVAVYDAGEYEAHVFIAMEFVEGQTLRQWQREAPRPWRDVLALYQQAAAGLAAAHEQGVVHRDFKPDNVMVDGDGRVRVMDFGLARAGVSTSTDSNPTSRAHDDGLTRTGSIMGTPAYMSPEQFANKEVGPASDQFGFCVALYEGLLGERPFVGANLADLASAVSKGQLRAPTKKHRVPGWLLRVLRTGLAVRPEDRHASMAALLAAVDRGIGMRRRWAMSAVAVLGGGLAIAAVLQPTASEQCQRAETDLRAVWTPERAQLLAAAFTRTGHLEADDAWQSVHERVDAFVTDWTEEHDHVCGTWRVALAPELVALRRDCLLVQREHLDGLLVALSAPTMKTIGFARAAASGLPAPHECAEIDSLDAAPPPEATQVVLEAQSLMARAYATRQAGDRASAKAGFLAALQVLGQTKAPRARARILGHLADLLYFDGALDEADRTLHEAQTLAAKSGDTQLLAKLWLDRVVEMNIHRREELDRQEHLLEAVDLAIAQAGSPETDVARVEVLRGMIAMDRAQYDVALVHLRRGLALAKETKTTRSRLASYEGLIGQVLMEQSDYAGARDAVANALAMIVETYGPEHPSALVHHGNLGGVCLHLGDLACAREHFEAVAHALDAVHDDESTIRADNLSHLATLEYQEHALDAAQQHVTEALALLAKRGESENERAATLRTLAYRLARDQNQLDEALEQAKAADRFYREHREPAHPQSVLGLTLVAASLRDLGRYDESLAAYTRVLEVREAALGAEHQDVSIARFNRAEVLMDQGKHAAALPQIERAYAALVAARARPALLAEAGLLLAQVRDATGDRQGGVSVAADAYHRLDGADPSAKQVRDEIETWLRERGVAPGLAVDE